MSTRHHPFLRWLILALLLFAQAAQAALPCLNAGDDLAMAAMAFSDPDPAFEAMHMDGHDGMAADEACPHDTNPNACLNQCTQDGQASGHAELPVIAPALAPVLTVARVQAALPAYACDNVGLRVAPDPPIPIRFCSFLN
ncbi:MAG: hypothetical protein ACOY4U_11845 [Pseudomonadota bacterium]